MILYDVPIQTSMISISRGFTLMACFGLNTATPLHLHNADHHCFESAKNLKRYHDMAIKPRTVRTLIISQ